MDAEQRKFPKITPIEFVENKPQPKHNGLSQLAHFQSVTRLYRYLFIGIGIVFCILGVTAAVKTIAWPCPLLFGNIQSIRSVLYFLCFGLAISSFTIGISMCSKQESCKNLISRGKTKLRRQLVKKKLEYGVRGSFYWGKKAHLLATLQHQYETFIHHMDEHQEEALHLLQKAKKDFSLDHEGYETAVNEVILELLSKIEMEIESFKIFSAPAMPSE